MHSRGRILKISGIDRWLFIDENLWAFMSELYFGDKQFAGNSEKNEKENSAHAPFHLNLHQCSNGKSMVMMTAFVWFLGGTSSLGCLVTSQR